MKHLKQKKIALWQVHYHIGEYIITAIFHAISILKTNSLTFPLTIIFSLFSRPCGNQIQSIWITKNQPHAITSCLQVGGGGGLPSPVKWSWTVHEWFLNSSCAVHEHLFMNSSWTIHEHEMAKFMKLVRFMNLEFINLSSWTCEFMNYSWTIVHG